MRYCIASPSTGTSKTIEEEDDRKNQRLHDKKIGDEFDGAILGESYKGYIFRIQGGSDKEGFPMKAGILANARVRLLLKPGVIGYQKWRVNRDGLRRRRTIRGSIVAGDLAVLNLMIVQKGDNEIEGLTDTTLPRMQGPKRASKIRKLFNLSLSDDVRKFVIKRPAKTKEGKKYTKRVGPKIQRLLTPSVIQRRLRTKRHIQEKRKQSIRERRTYSALLDKIEYIRRRRKELRQQGRVVAKVKAYLAANPKEATRYRHLVEPKVGKRAKALAAKRTKEEELKKAKATKKTQKSAPKAAATKTATKQAAAPAPKQAAKPAAKAAAAPKKK